MTVPDPRQARPRRAGVVTGLLAAAASAFGVVACWRVFVGTATGQRVDQTAFEGATLGRSRLWQLAEPILSVVSVPAIAVVLLAVMVVAVVRRRPSMAVQVAVLIGGANLTTQVLKDHVFSYPDLDVTTFHSNSLPSGHTTAAASVAAAVLFVVPPRARPWAAVLGAVYATATGVSTLIGQWHRPSDVVAALLVVLFWFSVASTMAATGRRAVDRPARPRPVRGMRHPWAGLIVAVLLLAAGALFAGIFAGTALHLVWTGPPRDDRAGLLTAYAGGALGVAAVTCLVFLTALLVRHSARVRTAGPPAPDEGGLDRTS